MVADDPSNWELARRLDQIDRSLRALVGRDGYTEYQRAIERQFAELARDIEDVRRQHTEDVTALHKRIGDEAKTATDRHQWKTMLWVGVFPAVVAVAAILVQVWLTKGK